MQRVLRHRGRRGAAVLKGLAIGGILSSLGLGGLVGYTYVGCFTCESPHYITKRLMRQAESSLQLHAAKHKGKFPTTSEGLAVVRYFPDGVPTDGWGRPFIYLSPGPEGVPYGLISLGEDGLAGGEGIDADIYSWEVE